MFYILTHLRFDTLGISLIFLFLALICFWAIKRMSKHDYFTNMNLLKEVYKKNSFWYSGCISIFIISIFLYALILGNPYIQNFTQVVKKDGKDIVFVLDISYSMYARDVLPNRLEATKSMFSNITQALPSDRIGVVIYSGKALQSVPLNYNHDFTRASIEKIDFFPIEMRELYGTATGDGLLMAYNQLKNIDPEREKIIILLSDGEENTGIQSQDIIQLLTAQNIKVYSIGLGKKETTTIQIPLNNGLYTELEVEGVNEEILKNISLTTGGKYYYAQSEDTLDAIKNDIISLEGNSELLHEEIIQKKYITKELSVILLLFLISLFPLIYYKKISF